MKRRASVNRSAARTAAAPDVAEMDGQRGPEVSLVDVAREAGASVGTVSRVMNGANVNESLRRKVIVAGRKLGFVPKLRQRRIGVLTGRQTPTLPVGYVSVMTSLITRAALAANVGVELFDMDSHTDIGRCHIDAAVGIVFDDRILELRDYPNLPLVTVNHPLADQGIDSIYANHFQQGFDAATHLLERGHRAIAFMAIESDEWGSRQRLAGYGAALAAAGLSVEPDRVGYSNDAPAYDIVGRWVRNGVTAILNFGEDTAAEVLHILSNILHRRIGQDISVITVEDLPIYQYFTPPQTVIRQPLAQMAHRAVEHVLAQAAAQRGPAARNRAVLDQCLPGELVLRDSVATLANPAAR
jgi:LacI family transcriptional regulator